VRIISIIMMLQLVAVGCRAQQHVQTANDSTPRNSTATPAASGPLFDGRRIQVVDGSSRLKAIGTNEAKNSCFIKVRPRIEAEFKRMNLADENQYFRFEEVLVDEGELSRNQLSIPQQEFSGTSMESLKKFDDAIKYLDSLNFYIIRAKAHRFLLATGHDPTTSGYGHYYRIHVLVPLGSTGPVTEFSSVTGDPRKIGIDIEGRLLIAQIDSVRQGAIDVESEAPLAIVVHLKTIGDGGKNDVTFKSTCTTADLEAGFDE
jgi:hypothetical protein